MEVAESGVSWGHSSAQWPAPPFRGEAGSQTLRVSLSWFVPCRCVPSPPSVSTFAPEGSILEWAPRACWGVPERHGHQSQLQPILTCCECQ